MAALVIAAAGIFGGSCAQAQNAAAPGWSYSVQPYLWLPTIGGTVNYHLPAGVGGSASVEQNPRNYLKGLNFAGMMAGEVRYNQFSVLADLIYVNISSKSSHLKTGNFAAVPGNPVSGTGTLDTSSRIGAGVWSLAGTHRVLQGSWGSVDALAGFRVVTVDAKTSHSAAITFTGPRGGTASLLGPGKGLSDSATIWNGMVGVRGQFSVGASGFFIPVYLDIGAGDSDLTWQAAGGIGYRVGITDLSIGWRYLSFTQSSSSVVHSLSLNGPYLAANFKF